MEQFAPQESHGGHKGPWDPKLQTPESRQALVEYAKQHGIKPAMRHFGCSRNTIRKWLRRFDTEGQTGLKGLPRGRKPRSAKAQSGAAKPAAPQYPWPSKPASPHTGPHAGPHAGSQPVSGSTTSVVSRPSGSVVASPSSAQGSARPHPLGPRQ